MRIVRPVAVLALLTAVVAGPLAPVAHAARATQPVAKAAPAKVSGTAPSQGASTQSRAGDPVGRNGVAQHELVAIAHTVETTAPSAIYAGVALDPQAGMVDLYLTDLSAGARDHALAGLSAAQRALVRAHRVSLNQVELGLLTGRAGVIVRRLVAAGLPIVSHGPDFIHSAVQITVAGPTPAQSRLLTQALAGLPIRIVTSPEMPKPYALSNCAGLSNRACDSAPWHGGDFVYDNVGYSCSDSWAISLGGKDYMVTAGHCDPAGSTFYNGSLVGQIGSSLQLGVGTQNQLVSNELDAMLIPVSSAQPSIWTGTYPQDTATSVTGAEDPYLNESICSGGAFDGTVCGALVSSVAQCPDIPYYGTGKIKACDIAVASLPGDSTAPVLSGEGDSGGPVYFQTASGITALGIVSAGPATAQCVAFPSRGKVCSTSVWFTAIKPLLGKYPGASLIPPVSSPVSGLACDNTVQGADSLGMIDFYHGSSLASAQAIQQNGIDPSLGSGATDFGAGFYITTDQNQAIEWAKLPSNNYVNPTVMHFRIPAIVLTAAVSCGRVFQQNGQVAPTSDYLAFVRTMRSTQPNPGGAGYDFVEGPLLLNPRAFLNGAPAITDGQQDAIFAAPHNLATIFDAGLTDIVPAGASASWIVGHAQHAGNDYPYETVGQFEHQNQGTDAWNEYYGQCDSFAAWKVYENLSVNPQHPSAPVPAVGWTPSNASVSAVNQFAAWAPGAGPGGNADVWSAQAQNWGATVDNVPTPGAIAWWPNAVTDPQDGNPPDPVHGFPGSSTGHVGYVTDVYPDGSITVESYNMRVNGEYSVVHMNYNTGYTDNSFSLPNFNIPWPGGFIHLGDGPAPGASSPAEPGPGVVHATYPSQVTVLGPGDGHGDFSLTGSAYPGTTNGWYLDAGHGEIGQELWTNTHPGTSNSTATWAPHLAAGVCYRIDAFVPNNWSNNDAALYIVADQHFGSSLVPVNENDTTNDWVQLGIFQAQGNGTLPVTLTDQGSSTGQIAADAMRYIPQSGCSGLVRASETVDYSNGTQLGGSPYPGTINGWYSSAGNGQLGNQYYTYTNGPTPSGSATWTASVIPNACYELFAYVPGNHSNDYQALYTIGSGGSGDPTVSVDENGYTNNFAGLGTYRATSTGEIVVILTDQSLANGDAFVAADTMSFVHTACPATVEGSAYPALTEGPGSPLAQFSLTSDWYNRFGHGDLGYEKWTNTHGAAAVSKATWTFAGLPASTTYSVCAFIPDNYANNTQAHYQGFQGTSGSAIFSSLTNQATTTGWTYIGLLYTSASVRSLRVVLDDTGPTGTYTAADAVRLTTGSC